MRGMGSLTPMGKAVERDIHREGVIHGTCEQGHSPAVEDNYQLLQEQGDSQDSLG